MNRAGICPACSRRARHDREKFGGLRVETMERDEYRGRCCGSIDDLVVHHRAPGRSTRRLLVTLCRGCHTKIHHTYRPGFSFPDALLALWREQHPALAEQMRLPLASVAAGEVEIYSQPLLFAA